MKLTASVLCLFLPANLGGNFGLFLGISLLSILEILDFIFKRIWCLIRKSWTARLRSPQSSVFANSNKLLLTSSLIASQPHSQGRTTETLVDSTCLQILLYHDSLHFYQYIINGEWEEKNYSKSNLTCLSIKILNWQTAQCSYLLLQPGKDEFTRPCSKNWPTERLCFVLFCLLIRCRAIYLLNRDLQF